MAAPLPSQPRCPKAHFTNATGSLCSSARAASRRAPMPNGSPPAWGFGSGFACALSAGGGGCFGGGGWDLSAFCVFCAGSALAAGGGFGFSAAGGFSLGVSGAGLGVCCGALLGGYSAKCSSAYRACTCHRPAVYRISSPSGSSSAASSKSSKSNSAAPKILRITNSIVTGCHFHSSCSASASGSGSGSGVSSPTSPCSGGRSARLPSPNTRRKVSVT